MPIPKPTNTNAKPPQFFCLPQECLGKLAVVPAPSSRSRAKLSANGGP